MGTLLSSISLCSAVHEDSSKSIVKQFYVLHGRRKEQLPFFFSLFSEVKKNINSLSRIKSCQEENRSIKLQNILHSSEKCLCLNVYKLKQIKLYTLNTDNCLPSRINPVKGFPLKIIFNTFTFFFVFLHCRSYNLNLSYGNLTRNFIVNEESQINMKHFSGRKAKV